MKWIATFLGSLKHRIEAVAETRYASWGLFGFAFLESAFLPLSPDYLNIPLSVAKPRRAFWYATLCIAGSVCGGLLGYGIGYALFESVGARLVETFGWTDMFNAVLLKYRENAWTALLLAGFTPIPFEVFTFAAGFRQTIPLGLFVVATILGRMLRFYAVAAVLYFFGPAVKSLLDKYLLRTAIAFLVLFVLWLLLTKYVLL